MFEDRTFDNIMSEMLSNVSSDVRTDEGSLVYNACSCIAKKLEDFYTDLSLLNDNITPTSMDEDHLISFGSERGIVYNYATPLVINATFDNEVSVNDSFNYNEFEFVVTDLIDDTTHKYQLECTETGVVPNIISVGSLLTPVGFIDGVDSGTITDIVSYGKDDDDIELYRTRVINSFKSNPLAGNKEYYMQLINNFTGVGGCKPVRRAAGTNNINIYIINDTFTAPSSSLVDDVQEYVDPSDNHGEGFGIAPLCHNVNIIGASECKVDIVLNLEYTTGFGWVLVYDEIMSVLNSFFLELRESWESVGTDSITIRIAQIIALLVDVTGIDDVNSISIGEHGSTLSSNNLVVTYTYIPILNSVTES